MTNQRNEEISFHEKERLSWILVSRIARVIDRELNVAITHPGGGLYDCLTLFGDAEQNHVQLNRNGATALVSGKRFKDTWTKAQADAANTALAIVKKSGLAQTESSESPNLLLAAAADLIAFHLEDQTCTVNWLWIDDQDGGGSANHAVTLEPGVVIPDHWSRLIPPGDGYGWQAWIWEVRVAGRSHSLLNFATGEVVYADAPDELVTVQTAIGRLYSLRTSNSGTHKKSTLELPLEVQEKIGHYVYALRDPRTSEVFYIGKGTHDRIIQHKKESDENPESEKAKLARIQQIEASGHQVEHFFIRSEIKTEAEAFAIEQAVIDSYDLAGLKLTNLVKGHHSLQFGLEKLQDLVAKHSAEPMQSTPQSFITLKLNTLWSNKLTEDELYLQSRRFWKVGEDARQLAQYAVVVAFGVVRQVYRIHSWEPTLVPEQAGKWEFNGEVAPEMSYLIGTHLRDSSKKGDASSYHKFLNGYKPTAKQ